MFRTMNLAHPIRTSLFTRIYVFAVAAILVLFAAIYLLSVPFIQRSMEAADELAAKTVLNNLFALVENMQDQLEDTRQFALLACQNELRAVMDLVTSRAAVLERQVKDGGLRKAQALDLLLADMRQMRYGNNDYFFAVDAHSQGLVHPDPEQNGVDMSMMRDLRGNLIIPPIVEGALTHGEGFHSYWWNRLGEDAPIEKLVFYRNFPFFEMVVGTGVYIDDIDRRIEQKRKEAIAHVRQKLLSTRLAKTGYLFVFDNETVLIHPNPAIEGQNIFDALDPVSHQPITEQLKAVADQDAVLRYKWDSPNDQGHFVYDKISWVRHVPELDWYICASVYVDELQESARALSNRVLLVFGLTLLIALVLIERLARHLSEPLTRMSDVALRATKGDLSARCALTRQDEIGVVAAAFDTMVEQIQDHIHNLDAKVKQTLAEQLKTEARLTESKDYNKLLFQKSQLAMIVLDPEAGFIDCNLALLQLIGCPSREAFLSERPPSRFSAPTQYDGTDSFTAAQTHIRITLDIGTDVFNWRARRPTGEIWDALIHMMRFDYQDQQLIQCSIRDVTEERRAEEERRKIERMKSEFLSSVSHELRTPLTSIRGFAALIEREFVRSFVPLTGDDVKLGKKAARIQENTGIIVKESERLTRMINDVLDLAKIESGRQNWNDKALNIADLVRDAANAVQGMFNQNPAVTLCIDVAPDLPTVVADVDKLQQVLVNLLNNAAKFTVQGTVTVHAVLNPDGQIQIEVRDTGCGFPPEEAEAIFDKFQQTSRCDTLTDKPKGTGLGLAIAREIIEHYGGRIWASSILGEGSLFAFVLPLNVGQLPGPKGRSLHIVP
jgi:PAS domain S-box-containing protein